MFEIELMPCAIDVQRYGGSRRADADTARCPDQELVGCRRREIGRCLICPNEGTGVVGLGSVTGSECVGTCGNVGIASRDSRATAAGGVAEAASHSRERAACGIVYAACNCRLGPAGRIATTTAHSVVCPGLCCVALTTSDGAVAVGDIVAGSTADSSHRGAGRVGAAPANGHMRGTGGVVLATTDEGELTAPLRATLG